MGIETDLEQEPDDLRATLEEAFEQHEADGPEHDAHDPAPDTDRGDGRTAQGRFARQKAQDDAQAAQDAQQGQPAPKGQPDPKTQQAASPGQPDPYARAPQSWKPGAREAWAQVPADVRAEIHRREGEATRVMQESAQAREVADFANQLGQRYAPALQAEGVDVGTAAANLFDTASRLRFGGRVEKAQIAANIIMAYGIDVEALAYVLEGNQGQMPQGRQMQAPMADPRVDQLFARLDSMQQQRAQAVMTKARNEVAGFGEDKEFFADVRADMADLMDFAAARGIDLTLDQAYERACSMNPEISKVMQARAQAQNAGTARSTQRSRAAASSVRGTPAGESTAAPPNTLRGDIEAAMESLER